MTMPRIGGSPRGSGFGSRAWPRLYPHDERRVPQSTLRAPLGLLSRPAAGGYHPSPMTAPARPLPSKPLDRSIVDGPIARAVWMLAWPTMLQNLIGGLQGMVDHALVGHCVGYAGNAAIGVLLTALNIVCNVAFITGLGPLPRLGTAGAAVGTTVASLAISGFAGYLLMSGRLPVVWRRGMDWRPDWGIIRELFRFGLPTGIQGIAMNVAGVLLLRFIGSLAQSAEAQAAYAVGYTELFSFITWTSVGLMGAAATVAGQNLGAHRPDRSVHGVHVAAGIGLGLAAAIGVLFLAIPRALLGLFGMTDPSVVALGVQLLCRCPISPRAKRGLAPRTSYSGSRYLGVAILPSKATASDGCRRSAS